MKRGRSTGQSSKFTSETRGGGTTSKFAKTGKARPAQFSENTRGQTETGFKQKTAKQVTAAMMGSTPSFAKTSSMRNKRRPGRILNDDAQFGRVPGKRVF